MNRPKRIPVPLDSEREAKVEALAQAEKRTITAMLQILIDEAIERRQNVPDYSCASDEEIGEFLTFLAEGKSPKPSLQAMVAYRLNIPEETIVAVCQNILQTS